MAIPVARVHLAMEHAALPGLLPTPPKCMMLPTPPCVVILPINSPPKPSRADAAERWDGHKIKPSGSPASSSSGSWSSLNGESGNPSSASKTNSPARSSSSRADSEERWDAHKKPVSLSSSSASSSKSRPSSSRGSSTAGRWDAHKTKPMAPRTTEELDDGERSSSGSNDMEYVATPTLPESAFYAGPGFMAGPDPSMLPMPALLMRSVLAA